MRATRSNGRDGGSSTTTYGGSHHQAASRDWTAEVSLSRGTGGTWAPGDRRTTFEGATPYATSVRARIQILAARGDETAEVAGETVIDPGYLVVVDVGQDASEGDVVIVTKNHEDPSLVDRSLRVDHVARGSELFERDLFCTLQTARAEAS